MNGMLRALSVFVMAFGVAGFTATAEAQPAAKAEKPAKAAKSPEADKAAKEAKAADAKAAREAKSAEAKAARETAKTKLNGHYAILVSEAQLDESQQSTVSSLVNELNTSRKQWDEANGAKLKELSEQAKTADPETAKKLRAEARELAASKAENEKKHKQRIEAVLRPEQSRSWAAYGMYHRAATTLHTAGMTDAQKQQARALADQMIQKEFNQQPADDEKIKALYPAYLEAVKADVLTAEQKSQLEAAAAAKAEARKKAAEEAKAKKAE